MVGFRPTLWWRLCWQGFSPALIVVSTGGGGERERERGGERVRENERKRERESKTERERGGKRARNRDGVRVREKVRE